MYQATFIMLIQVPICNRDPSRASSIQDAKNALRTETHRNATKRASPKLYRAVLSTTLAGRTGRHAYTTQSLSADTKVAGNPAGCLRMNSAWSDWLLPRLNSKSTVKAAVTTIASPALSKSCWAIL